MADPRGLGDDERLLLGRYRLICQAFNENPFISHLIQRVINQVLYEVEYQASEDAPLDKACVSKLLKRYVPTFGFHLVWSGLMYGDSTVGYGRVRVRNSVGKRVSMHVPVVAPLCERAYHQDELEYNTGIPERVFVYEPSWIKASPSSIGNRMAGMHQLYTHMINGSMLACQSGALPTAVLTREKFDPNVFQQYKTGSKVMGAPASALAGQYANEQDDVRAFHSMQMELVNLQDAIYDANREKMRASLTPYSRTTLDDKADAAETSMVRTYAVPGEGIKVTPVHSTGKVEQFDHFLPAMRAALAFAAGFIVDEKRDRSARLQISDQGPEEPSVFMNRLLMYVNDVMEEVVPIMFRGLVPRGGKYPAFVFSSMPHMDNTQLAEYAEKEMQKVTAPDPPPAAKKK